MDQFSCHLASFLSGRPCCGLWLIDRKLACRQTSALVHAPASTASQKSSALSQVGNCGWLVFLYPQTPHWVVRYGSKHRQLQVFIKPSLVCWCNCICKAEAGRLQAQGLPGLHSRFWGYIVRPHLKIESPQIHQTHILSFTKVKGPRHIPPPSLYHHIMRKFQRPAMCPVSQLSDHGLGEGIRSYFWF